LLSSHSHLTPIGVSLRSVSDLTAAAIGCLFWSVIWGTKESGFFSATKGRTFVAFDLLFF